MQDLPPETRRNLILSVGTHRDSRPLSPVEVAEAIEAALASGATPAELADALHLDDPTMFTRFRRLLKLPPNVRHLVDWGRGKSYFSFSVAAEIARLSSVEEQQDVAAAVLEQGLSKGEVQQITQIRERSGKPIQECVREILRLRPQIQRRHLLIGAITSDQLQRILGQMTQQQRDQLLRTAISTHSPELPPWEGRLGVERFDMVGSEAFGAAVQRLPGGFEQAINTYLESEVTRT